MNTLARTWPLLTSLLLTGCESCPTIRAAWYRLGQQANDGLVLALLNEGGNQAQVTRLTVNPSRRDGEGGWSTTLDRPLAPGELRVVRLDRFVDDKDWPGQNGCRVPVALTLQCKSAWTNDRVLLEGTLPNYLPGAWIERCVDSTGQGQP